MKKTISILLSILLLFGTCAFALTAAAKDAQTYAVGDVIQFGTYPQTRVEETPELLAAANAATWKSYRYYTSFNNLSTGEPYNGWMQPKDYMKFADFFNDGVKYRAVQFFMYRPSRTGLWSNEDHSFQDNNGYTTQTIYYFRYEPINWCILDPTTGFVLSERILDSQAYQNVVWESQHAYWNECGSSVRANDYTMSSIRDWLNYDFYETAFTEGQKAKIKTTVLQSEIDPPAGGERCAVDINDKILLLSFKEIRDAECLSPDDENTKYVPGTDYAKCQGLSGGDTSEWWLRTPNSDTLSAGASFWGYSIVNSTNVGVRPACYVTDLNSDTTQVDRLFSADTHEHTAGSTVIEANIAPTCTTAGSNDEVQYCTQCSYKLSHIRTTLDPLDHRNAQTVSESKPTAAAHGYTAGVFCPDCNTWLSGHDVIHNQLGAREVVKEATENEEGEVYIVCTVCGESGLYALEKLPHTEPQPEQPSGNGGSPNIFERIRLFAKSIVDWFLRLIRWIGKR